jgi:Domain of unknown function (DUF4166)
VVAVAEGPGLSCHSADGVGLFGMLLGTSLGDLPAIVRRFHAADHDVMGYGTLRVEQSKLKIGRLVARLTGMPTTRGDVPVVLTIRREADRTNRLLCEQWCRSFQGEVMASSQTTDGKCLLERVGPLEFCFDLEIADQRLRFNHIRTRARLGALRLSIPWPLCPTIHASVGATASGDQLDVSVEIGAPVLGTLLYYAGPLTPAGVT